MRTKNLKSTVIAPAFFAALGMLMIASSNLLAQPTTLGQIGKRALTPNEIKTYGLPSDTQVSGGLSTVGLGQPFYLEVEILSSVPKEDILGVTWSLNNKPLGSEADLEATPILPEMPPYNPGDRDHYFVASRILLRPDMVGTYEVSAEVDMPSGPLTLTTTLVGATFLGYNNSCLFCHSGGYLPDKIGPWSKTHHSMALSNFLDGVSTDHFRESCIKCHSTGFDDNPLAVNGGWDDARAAHPEWMFPSELVPGNYDALPQDMKDKSNVQCESCHGAGSEHAYGLGKTNNISVSFSAGDCAQCHAADPYHVKGVEWANSQHAISTRYPSGEGRETCVRCHSAPGFVDYTDGVPEAERRTQYEAITCAACHDPHGVGNPHMLRRVAEVTLMDNITTVSNGGLGQLCMNCHISRRDAVSYVETGRASSRFGPHNGPQTDMLVGANAYTYGKEIPSSAHAQAVENTCVACHLQEVASSEPGFLNVGGHTFRNHWDGGTPDIDSDDVSLVGLCSQCHGDIESFDFKRTDINGDGIVEGIQTEVKGLLDQLGVLLPPLGSPTVSINSSYSRPQLAAAYNYRFVEADGSFGVHNLSYAVGLLKASIQDLTDDADHDGLSDTWEIMHFGSITLYDGNGDVDEDGVNNALELAAGTNPTLKDSDGDGFFDGVELEAGSDPTNADDQPGFVVQIYTAAEIEFASEIGKRYQVQQVSELSTTWANVGAITNGTGNNISMVTSARSNGDKAFFRVVEVE